MSDETQPNEALARAAEWMEQIRDDGRRAGYDEGYKEGRNDGYQEGLDDGETRGVLHGDAEALAALKKDLNYLELKFAGVPTEKVLGYLDGYRDAIALVKTLSEGK